MAASLTTRVGLPKARSKSKPAQPEPRLTGSWATRPATTGAGTPTETTSYSQSFVTSSTCSTICAAVRSGPETNRRRSPPVLSSTLTCEPPTSTARTRGFVVSSAMAE